MTDSAPRRALPPIPAPPAVLRVVGAPRAPLRDVYHAFMRASWATAIAGIVVVYLALNALFAAGYRVVGGVTGARPHSYADSFYFSIQTMGTIGYGSMYPTTAAAHALVATESVVGLLVLALATGLIFAKFSRPSARIAFGRYVGIAPVDGVPTVMIRVGNERGNRIVDAQIRVAFVRTERTKEGLVFYRMVDLRLTRDRAPALSRGWTVMHAIADDSPFAGQSPAKLKAAEVELLLTISGVDDTSMQPVHAQFTYSDDAIAWGVRHADMLSEEPDGSLTLDVRKFHDMVDADAISDFPYGRGAAAPTSAP